MVSVNSNLNKKDNAFVKIYDGDAYSSGTYNLQTSAASYSVFLVIFNNGYQYNAMIITKEKNYRLFSFATTSYYTTANILLSDINFTLSDIEFAGYNGFSLREIYGK